MKKKNKAIETYRKEVSRRLDTVFTWLGVGLTLIATLLVLIAVYPRTEAVAAYMAMYVIGILTVTGTILLCRKAKEYCLNVAVRRRKSPGKSLVRAEGATAMSAGKQLANA